tara:strand:- start:4545 stop:5186 length:642 start_codon:yes stop_codon:yes gene_type:complete
MKLKRIIFSLLTVLLVSGCVQEAKVDMPGFNYMEKKIFLNVASIHVINEYKPQEKDLNKYMLPASIISELDHWLRNRFIAAGKKGTAVIRILNANVVENGLKDIKDTHETLTVGGPDRFGAEAQVVIDVRDLPEFSEGQAEVSLSRIVSIESDVKMSFRLQIWGAFVQNFMNALDDQFMMNIETYLPGLTIPAFVVNQMAKKELEDSMNIHKI